MTTADGRVHVCAARAGRMRAGVLTGGMCLLFGVNTFGQIAEPTTVQQASAREPAVTWGAGVEALSRYVWRGFEYSEGAAVWPSAWIAAHGFTASVLLNYDHHSNPAWNELDVEATYERTFGRLTLNGGYSRYHYFEIDSSEATGEIIARADFAIGPGRIYTAHAADVEQFKGSYYVETGYAIDRELGAKSSVSADVSVAIWPRFIDEYTREADTPITDGMWGPIALNLSYLRMLSPNLGVKPSVSFMRIGDAEARRLLSPPGVTASVAIVIGR